MSLPDPAPRPAPGTSGRPFGCPAPEALLALARLSDDAILIVREDIEDGTREIAWSNPAPSTASVTPSVSSDCIEAAQADVAASSTARKCASGGVLMPATLARSSQQRTLTASAA